VLPGDEHVRPRVVAGTDLPSAGGKEVLVSELLLYRLGVVNEADVANALGKRLHLEYRTGGGRQQPVLLWILLNRDAREMSVAEEKLLEKVQSRLPEALEKLDLPRPDRDALRKLLRDQKPTPPTESPETTVGDDFTICGVTRALRDDEARFRSSWYYQQADVLLPAETAGAFYLRAPANAEQGFSSAVVEVDDVDHVKAVNEALLKTGLGTSTFIERIEQEQKQYLIIFTAMTVIAAVSLLVSALGIVNTMLMSVLERVREIGVYKAVGARPGHIQAIFLVEGALLGLTGGLLGLLLAWGTSALGDAWLRAMIQRDFSVQLDESIFAFPWWLVAGAPLFVCAVTTLAAYYPARQAARVDPVKALRHE
jgi:putative ABC transport system permease protein